MKIFPLDCLATFFEEARRSGVFELYYIDLYSAGFTLDTYAHVTSAMQSKAANTLSSFLSGAIQ